MADIKGAYGGSNQAITVTLASLADNALRESTAIDNTSNLFVDAFVGGKITTGTSPTGSSILTVYAYGTVDGGTIYSGDASGTDAAYTGQKDQLFRLGIITTDSGGTSDTAYEFGPWSIRAAFGGLILPALWGIVVLNETDAALHATGGNHDINYQGVYATG